MSLFLSGLAHPLLGADHIITMLAVGVLGVQLSASKRSAMFALPAMFVGMMFIGGIFGMSGVRLPQVELVIAASVIILGAMIVRPTPFSTSMGLVGLFAVFHGHAHGSEVAGNAAAITYVVGFVISTALLHVAGIAFAMMSKQLLSVNVVRVAGAAMAVFGVVLLAGTVATPASAATTQATTQAVDSQLCQITLVDGNTDDWANIAPVVNNVPDDNPGTTYYWTGDEWVTEEPESYTHTVNVDEMAELEEIKVCNNQKAMFVYVDTVHPIFGIYDVAHAQFVENNEQARWRDDTTTDLPTNPQAFDNWAVISMQRQKGEQEKFYYAIHLVAPVGINGMDDGPAVEALYQDNGDGAFNPNSDKQLVVFENDSTDEWFEYRILCDLIPGLDICYNDFNERGAIEVTMQLVNSAGRGLFTETPIQYGEVLSMAVEMVPSSRFEGRTGSSTTQAVSKTDNFNYRIASAVPEGLVLSDIPNRPHRMRLNWDSMSEVSEYRIRVRNANKKVIQRKTVTNQTHAALRGLKSGKEYRVQVRAKFGSSLTPWSRTLKFVQ